MKCIQSLPQYDGFRARAHVGATQICGPLRRGPDAAMQARADVAELRRVQDALNRVARETRALLCERSPR